MSKSKLFEIEETQLTYNAAVLLHHIADGLARGSLRLNDGSGDHVLEVGKQVKVSCSAKSKEKSDGFKNKLEIEVTWYAPLEGSR